MKEIKTPQEFLKFSEQKDTKGGVQHATFQTLNDFPFYTGTS